VFFEHRIFLFQEVLMKLIALDLDGTLLNSDKVVSQWNFAALSLAAEQGHVIVPATGRALRAIPEQVMAFPFLHYAITINGAKVSDTRTGEAFLRAEIALDTCLRLLDFAGRYDAMYDCYWNDTGWVDRSFLERVRYYNADEEVVTLLRTTRAPVDDLKAFLRKNGQPVQKVQLCFRDMAERETARAEIAAAFPEILVTSSFRNNLELNAADADKGRALLALAQHLGIPAADTIAFGDSSNDLRMLRAAGTSVAMGNAAPEVRAVCDYVTETNDRDGVAAFLHAHVLH
jgi:Cof subfamily protein (haloacid dehalogenase superfamily)